MQGLTKEQLQNLAKENNVDIEGLAWPDQVKKVNEAIANKEAPTSVAEKSNEEKIAELEKKLKQSNEVIKAMRQEYEDYDKGDIPSKEDYDAQPVMLAPEMTPHKTDPNLSRYSNKEKIGEGLIVEEVSYGLDDIPKDGEQKLHGSYRIKGKSNQVVTAFSRGPRCQPGLYWWGTKEKDELFQELTWNGEECYLWSHVRAVIKSVNGGKYLKKYQDEIKENLMPMGHRLGINKQYVHDLLDAIQDEEQSRKQRGY